MKYQLDVSKLGCIAGEIERRIKDGHIPGSACNIWYKGQKVYETYLGYADTEGTPLNEDHIYHWASMTKAVTAVAMLQQIELGRVGLDDPIEKYIPEFADLKVVRKDENENPVGYVKPHRSVTVRDCMTHTCGIASGPVSARNFDRVAMREGESLSDFVPRYASLPLEFEPGSRTAYSAVAGPDVVACIVEKVSGEEYRSYLKNHITGPLQMTDTCYDLPESKQSRVVRAFAFDSKTNTCIPSSIPPAELRKDLPYLISGGGALCGTLKDYTNFVHMLYNKGELFGKRILSPDSVKLMTTPQQPLDLEGMAPGYIWGLLVRVVTKTGGDHCSPLPVGSYTWSGAWGTHFIVIPDADVFGVYMSNTTTSGGCGCITEQDYERAVASCLIPE